MFGWFKRKSELEKLRPTKTIKINGIIFRFKKIDITNYLDGSQSILKLYDIYSRPKITNDSFDINAFNKLKKHYADVLLGAVLKPSLTRDENCGDKICINEIFNDWDLANKLYEAIISFSYGKKKMKLLNFQEKN